MDETTTPLNGAGTTVCEAPEVSQTPAPAPKKTKKPHKKRSKKKIVFLVLLAAVVGWFAISQIVAAVRGPLPTAVGSETAAQGAVSQSLSTSGTLVSGNKVTVYSPVSAPIETLGVKLGDRVSAGDTIATFDTTTLERAYQTASAAAANGGLQKQDSLSASDTAQKNFNDAAANLQNMAVQKDNAAATLAGLTAQYAAFADPTTAEAQAVKAKLDAAAADLQAMETALTSAKAAYDTAKGGVLSDSQKKQLENGQVAAGVTLAGAKEDLAAGRAGLSAPISGVVTSLSADAGAMAAQHAAVCVIQGMDDVRVDVSLSRYDLEKVKVGQAAVVTVLGKSYEGRVESIDAVATQTASNTGTASYVHAQIKLSAPDDALILGIDANVVIDTGSVDNAVTVPVSAVNTDVQGQFCYVIENGVAVRRAVTTGLSSDTRIEITDGIAVGDVVITEPDLILAEGQAVTSAGSTADAASDTVPAAAQGATAAAAIG